jgi:hypothetical protein
MACGGRAKRRAAVVVLIIFLLGVVALWSLALFALVEASRLPVRAYRSIGRSRAGTVAGILLSGGFGAVYYLLAIRRKARAAAATLPSMPAVVSEAGSYRSYRKGDDPWAVSS